jgi:hypothetical protein
MPPAKIDSLADDVKSMVLGLLEQISGLTARVEELLAQNKALLARIAELEAKHGKASTSAQPPKTPDNSSLPPSRSQKGNVAEAKRRKKARKGHPGAARALAENPDATRCIYAECESRRLVTRLKFANLRQTATIEDLNTKAARGLDKALFAKLATAQPPADMPEGSPFGPGIKAAVAYRHNPSAASSIKPAAKARFAENRRHSYKAGHHNCSDMGPITPGRLCRPRARKMVVAVSRS